MALNLCGSSKRKKDIHGRKWIVWALAVAFYFYEYFLRVSPSVIVDELMKDFHIGASQIGVISSFYFYTYAIMQIPVGVMMDRFGARKLLTFGSIACGLGGILFGVATTTPIADIGRVLQGAGSAFAFLGMVYICSHWFPASKLAFLVGLGNSLGMLGAAGGAGPLATLIDFVGWRSSLISLGFVGIGLAIVMFLVVRNEPSHVTKHAKIKLKNLHIREHLTVIVKNKQTWVAAIITITFLITTTSFGALWGVPFIKRAFNVSDSAAGYGISIFFLGWIVGGPIIGHYSDYIEKRRPVFILCGLLSALFMILLIYFPYYSIYVAYAILFIVGFFSSAQNLGYCVAIELNPIQAKGTAIALSNCLVYAVGAFVQPLVGKIIQIKWSGAMQNGIPSYTLKDFQSALFIFPLAYLIAVITAFFLKEKQVVK